MEKTIYIPGDLVMTNGIPIGTKKGIVYQVTNTLSCLCYVHELQHLLFGLNINHEMEV